MLRSIEYIIVYVDVQPTYPGHEVELSGEANVVLGPTLGRHGYYFHARRTCEDICWVISRAMRLTIGCTWASKAYLGLTLGRFAPQTCT